MEQQSSDFVMHVPCPKCGSSDANSLFTDGHAWCFGCNHYTPGDGMEHTESPAKGEKGLIPIGEYSTLTSRKLTAETCRKWDYSVSEFNGKPVQIATYHDDDGSRVSQKLRFPDKTFSTRGNHGKGLLYGKHLWRDKGRRIVITEGEIDAMSVSQAFNNKWPVVSIPNGSNGAAAAITANLEWLQGYEEVVLLFDQDEPGRAATQECAILFEPGKCKIAYLPVKDASDMLKAGKITELVDAIFGAKEFRPDGIINGTDMADTILLDDSSSGYPFPWTTLNTMTEGYRDGEVVMWTAGSGVGKSAVVREVEFDALMKGHVLGILRLEENTKRAGRGLMGLAINQPAYKKSVWNGLDAAKRKHAYDLTLGTGRVFLYDHFGSSNIDNLVGRIRFMGKGLRCKVVVLDHISIVVSGEEDGDERRLIDNLMTKLKSVAMECNIVLHVISHLKRPTGDKGHEEGARVSLSQLRGSHAIAQLSDTVIGLERNGQDENHKNITTIRILKCRETGETGEAGWLAFDPVTGRMSECETDPYAQMPADNNNGPMVGDNF